MADPVFFDGMPNVNEKLNELYANFAAGPYNALPLTGGNLTGAVTSNSNISTSAVLEAQMLRVGPGSAGSPRNTIRGSSTVGTIGLELQGVAFYYQTGGFGVTGLSVIDLNKNATNNRSISSGGTINASGADYAEYMVKDPMCGAIVPGQIVGIDAAGRLTDKWDLAISFAVKSTNPCMVGGDTWAAHLGQRPEGDQTEYDAALEFARQAVDRIAFAGQVPVNLQGAVPGQFIVPVQDGDGIGGLAIDEADITLRQYMRAIGRVIAIEDDGRARIIVKVV